MLEETFNTFLQKVHYSKNLQNYTVKFKFINISIHYKDYNRGDV